MLATLSRRVQANTVWPRKYDGLVREVVIDLSRSDAVDLKSSANQKRLISMEEGCFSRYYARLRNCTPWKVIVTLLRQVALLSSGQGDKHDC
jgi:hypothetical protein